MKNFYNKLKSIFSIIIDRIRPYYFDTKNLSYKRLDMWFFVVVILIASFSFYIGWFFSAKNDIENRSKYDEEAKLIFIKNGDDFSEEKLILFIKELNFKYPGIVYAQAVLESGVEFNSDFNIQNNNYFGMQDANKRINIQSGIQNKHAYYYSWRNSVIDYGLFCAAYLSDFKTKDEYYQYIEKHYSETPGYTDRVRKFEQRYFEILSTLEGKNSYDFFKEKVVKLDKPKSRTKKADSSSFQSNTIDSSNTVVDSLKN